MENIQHPTTDNQGVLREGAEPLNDPVSYTEMKDLPRDFVFVPPVAIMKDMEPLKQQLPDSLVNTQVQELIDDDKTHEWLEKVKTLLSNRGC